MSPGGAEGDTLLEMLGCVPCSSVVGRDEEWSACS